MHADRDQNTCVFGPRGRLPRPQRARHYRAQCSPPLSLWACWRSKGCLATEGQAAQYPHGTVPSRAKSIRFLTPSADPPIAVATAVLPPTATPVGGRHRSGVAPRSSSSRSPTWSVLLHCSSQCLSLARKKTDAKQDGMITGATPRRATENQSGGGREESACRHGDLRWGWGAGGYRRCGVHSPCYGQPRRTGCAQKRRTHLSGRR